MSALFPPGVAFPISRALAQILGFAYARPYLFRPGVWRLTLAAGVLLMILVIVQGSGWLVVIPLCFLALGLAGLAGWWRLMRGPDRPILAFISRLSPSTPDAHGTTVNHQLVLLDGLADDSLSAYVEGRPLSPLGRSDAERVLSASPTRLVLYGEARVAGQHWLAHGGILIDTSRPVLDGRGERHDSAPVKHETFRDPSLELEGLVGDGFSAKHVEILHAELLDLAVVLEL